MLALFFSPDRGDCRSRKMLQNEYLVAKIGFDDADNEPLQVWVVIHSSFNPVLRRDWWGLVCVVVHLLHVATPVVDRLCASISIPPNAHSLERLHSVGKKNILAWLRRDE